MNNTIFRLPPRIIVHHMESDRLIPGQILYSDIDKLHTTNGNNITDVFDMWEVNGTGIWGFTQTSEYDIVIVDRYNHCLRLYNRLQDTVKKLVGSCDCKSPGLRDGTAALFNGPMKVIQDSVAPCLLYVIDFHSHALRMVTKSRIPHVTTLIKNDHKKYMGVTQEPEGIYLYITYSDGLERYDLVTNTSIDIVSKTTWYANDAWMQDGAMALLEGIILYKDMVFMADSSRHVLFVVDLTTNTTSTICTGVAGHRSGNTSFCQLDGPEALLKLNGDIYIGEEGHISILRGTTYCSSQMQFPKFTREWFFDLQA